MTIVQKIRERRLFQIALSFAGGAWVVLEVFDQLVDRGIVPELVYQVALIWVVVGIPAAALVGWYHGEKGSQRAPKSEVISLAFLAVLALGLSGMTVTRHRADAQIKSAADNVLEMRRLAVLYFDDQSPDKKYDYLADGLTESLIDALDQVRDLDVVSSNGSAQFRNADLPVDSVAKLLNAGTIVQGRIEERNDKIRIDVRVLDGKSGAQIGEAAFERPAGDVLALKDSLSAQTALLLREFLGPQIRIRDAARTTTNTQAWLLLQRAEKTRKNAETLPPADPAAQKLYDEADQLLTQAEAADPEWAEASVARASVLYRRAYRLQTSPADAYAFATRSLEHAEEALRRDKNNARALELRGTANYFNILLGAVQDPVEQKDLLARAQQDLETALQLNPSLATAHSTLSHMFYRSGDMTNAAISAQRALTEDAYLEAADLVLWRLFNASWELGDFPPAKRWCDEGARRFPTNFRFVSCAIRLLTAPTTEPDIDRAWALLAQQDSMLPPARRGFEHLRAELLTGAVIARRAEREPASTQLLRDSARAVLNRASQQVTPQVDPNGELIAVEAYCRTVAGDKDGAIALLEREKARNPATFRRVAELRWYWKELQTHPRFARLYEPL